MEQDLRYPIGKYNPQPYSEELRAQWLEQIRTLPDELEQALAQLPADGEQLRYREGGWTARQVVHHLADSHMHAYIRCKLGLTRNAPVVSTYEEAIWAELPDTALPARVSLELVRSLHARWWAVLKDLDAGQWERTIFHPERNGELTLWYLLGMYAWHGRHHVAHIRQINRHRTTETTGA